MQHNLDVSQDDEHTLPKKQCAPDVTDVFSDARLLIVHHKQRYTTQQDKLIERPEFGLNLIRPTVFRSARPDFIFNNSAPVEGRSNLGREEDLRKQT